MKKQRMKNNIALSTLLLWAPLHTESIDELITHANNALHARQPSIALAYLQQAHKQDTSHHAVLDLLGKTSFYLEHYDDALMYYKQLLTLDNRNVNALYNSAVITNKMGDFATATKFFYSLSKQISHEMVQTNLLKNYLRLEQWDNAAAILKPTLWWYDENIFEKTILLELDKPGNGLGDAIQFVRYAQLLHQAGARVIVQVHAPLVNLFSRCPYIDAVITTKDPVARVHKKYGICIASLMIKSKNFQRNQTPYLTADQELIKYWQDRIASDTKFKIGICFSSSFVIDQWSSKRKPSPRSIPEQELLFLNTIDNVSLYNLQKDKSIQTQLPLIEFDDFDESHGRFMDTAALMKNMDLIITVDTSIAHLAGALGVPTILILCTESDYRWLSHRTDSPYYPSITILKQQSINSWQTVIAQLKTDLIHRIAEKN